MAPDRKRPTSTFGEGQSLDEKRKKNSTVIENEILEKESIQADSSSTLGSNENEKADSQVTNEKIAKSTLDSSSTEASGALSMSIEDTNKLRLQLGLAPLETEDTQSKDITDEYTHAPAKNIADEKLAEKYREKLQLMKEKREIEKRLQTIKPLHILNSDESYLDDASSWVRKMRSQPSQNIVLPKLPSDEKSQTPQSKALVIEHDQKEFEMGEEAILTLKDADVLDTTNDDTLINLNLVETRKAKENIKNRTKASNYNPYDEYDEETGQLKPAGLLSKYNEEIYGKSVPNFKIDLQDNNILPGDTMTQFMESVKHLNKQSLNSANIRIGKDYMTNEEFNLTFKKSSKKRSTKRSTARISQTVSISNKDDEKIVPSHSSITDSVNHMSTPPSIEEDAAASELHQALEKARQTKLKSIIKNESYIENIISNPTLKKDTTPKKDSIVFDSTSEFVRTHDLIPHLKTQIKEPPLLVQETVSNKTESYYGTIEKDNIKQDSHKSEVKRSMFVEEPILHKGVGAALALLSAKGYIEGGNKKNIKAETNIPKTKAVVDRDKMESLYRGNRRRDDNYSSGPVKNINQEYKFDFDLEYYDKAGVPLTPKEAFRDVSHKFHGKRPAKKKQVKRAEQKGDRGIDVHSASHEDDIAKTLNIMVEKQKTNQTPFLVLTGSNMNLLASSNILKQTKKM